MPDGSQFKPFIPTSGDSHSEQITKLPVAFAPLAERLTESAGNARGKFVVAAYGKCPATGARIADVRHIENGPSAAEGLVAAATSLAKMPGANVYVLPALMSPDLQEGRKGGIADVVGVLAVVCDWDCHNGPPIDYESKLPTTPHFVVETSPGSFQAWLIFDTPQAPADVQPILDTLVAESEIDRTGAEPSHVFRVPGGSNWPNEAKIRKGRAPEPVLAKVVVTALWRHGYSIDYLREVIEKMARCICSARPESRMRVRRSRAKGSSAGTNTDRSPGFYPARLRSKDVD
jgi:hypothetical protein